MSLGTCQGKLLLVMARTILVLIETMEEKLDPEIESTLMYASDLAETVANKYPETGNARKNSEWMQEAWGKCAATRGDSEMLDQTVLSTLVLNIYEDLAAKTNNKQVREGLQDMVAGVKHISAHYANRSKDEYKDFAEADKLLDQMYQQIGFIR